MRGDRRNVFDLIETSNLVPGAPLGRSWIEVSGNNSDTCLVRTNARPIVQFLAQSSSVTAKRGNAVLVAEGDRRSIQETLHYPGIPGMRDIDPRWHGRDADCLVPV